MQVPEVEVDEGNGREDADLFTSEHWINVS